MCTAITFDSKNHYFCRNLDFENRHGEEIVITPRNYIFRYRSGMIERRHNAMIGTARIAEDYPLYFDATNEHGLSICGLNFVGNAAFLVEDKNKVNLAPYELIPYILGKCKCIAECIDALREVNIVDIPFNPSFQNAELHWFIADKERAITLEIVREGMKIYDNPMGVLTNNPPFEYHTMNLNNYLGITRKEPMNQFSEAVDLCAYSRGMGGLGLPGDLSSASRFVRAAFTKLNSVKPSSEEESVGQAFHILASVEQQEGCVAVGNKFERTQYSSCCNMDEGIYYYKTYENSQITAVKMHSEDVDSDKLISY